MFQPVGLLVAKIGILPIFPDPHLRMLSGASATEATSAGCLLLSDFTLTKV